MLSSPKFSDYKFSSYKHGPGDAENLLFTTVATFLYFYFLGTFKIIIIIK